MNMGNRLEKHVVPNSDRGGWDVKNNNALRVSKHFDTKAEAMDWAREQAKKDGAELIPHKMDGTIQNPNSYGGDSCPPKDLKH